MMLREARALQELMFQNVRLMIFPDYSMETQRQRKSFDVVPAKLRAKGLKYSILFPARLRVEDGKTTNLFTSPAEASFWIEMYADTEIPFFTPLTAALNTFLG